MPIIESIPEDGAGDGLGALKAARVCGWISQGTEKEMEMETVVPMREKVHLYLHAKIDQFSLARGR